MDNDDIIGRLKVLGDAPVGPPAVDLTAAMRVGRGRLQRKRIGTAAVTVAAVAAVIAAVPVSINLVRGTSHHGAVADPSTTSVATATPSATSGAAAPTSLTCTEHELATPDPARESITSGADPTGQYVIGRLYGSHGPTQVAIWHAGTITTFTIPGMDAVLRDVTSDGVAIGASFQTETVQVGWVYANGKLSRLPGPAGAAPAAINESGVISGNVQIGIADGYPVVWHSASSTPERLAFPGSGWTAVAGDVDTDGTILGAVVAPGKDAVEQAQGAVWHPDGTITVLPVPTDVVPGATGLWVDSIRDGLITGEAVTGNKDEESFTPVTYDLATGTFTAVHATMRVRSGNGQGGIIGTGRDIVPAVYTPGTGLISLPTLLAHSDEHIDLGADSGSISDDGHILTGQDVDRHDVIHAVEWICQ